MLAYRDMLPSSRIFQSISSLEWVEFVSDLDIDILVSLMLVLMLSPVSNRC